MNQNTTRYVIVEGLYLFLKEWNTFDLFDLKIFLDCDFEIAANRLIPRHVAAGIVSNEEEGKIRVEDNDLKNAEYIL